MSERFLVEARSHPTTVSCGAINKTHVHKSVKTIPIITVVFTITQYNKVRILIYIL
jgi:hypothetical protein